MNGRERKREGEAGGEMHKRETANKTRKKSVNFYRPREENILQQIIKHFRQSDMNIIYIPA